MKTRYQAPKMVMDIIGEFENTKFLNAVFNIIKKVRMQ